MSTLAGLREQIERERALLSLGGDHAELDAVRGEVCNVLGELPAVRIPLRLFPTWWLANQDRTQVDGRVLIKWVRVYGAGSRLRGETALQIPNGPSFHLTLADLMDAIERGEIVEAT